MMVFKNRELYSGYYMEIKSLEFFFFNFDVFWSKCLVSGNLLKMWLLVCGFSPFYCSFMIL